MQGGDAQGQLQRPASPEEPPRMLPKDWRRRSADVGGLNLATRGFGQGQGWMGGDSASIQTTVYAEMLSDLYTETSNSVNDNSSDLTPASLPVAVKARLIRSLDRWQFEPQQLPDDEVLLCTLIIFETLFRIEGMAETIPIGMSQVIAFIHHLRQIYRYENTYHNFEHALDVLQATHCYLKSAGMVPSPEILLEKNRLFKSSKEFNGSSMVSCLGLRELFVLYVAAIGHDVGHPGFSNMFMKNANAPLSLVFDHSSALEQMHYQLLLRVMRHHGLGILLDDPQYGTHIRDILRLSVIATDMGVHKDFMERFKRLTEGEAGTLCQRQTIVCQAILKNADISNPSRPFKVSTQWAKALMQEWTAQANLELEYDMTPTVMTSSDPLKEANSQIFFITHFVRPMLELTVKAIPEMALYLTHCKNNLKTWTTRKTQIVASQEHAPSQVSTQGPSNASVASTSSSASSRTTVNLGEKPDKSPRLPSRRTSSASTVSTPSSIPPLPTSPRSQADSFMTVFPLTLPTYTPRPAFPTDLLSHFHHHTHSSSSSSRPVSEHESLPPDSPSGDSSEASGSPSVFSPVTEGSSNGASGFRHHPNRSTSNSSLASMSSSVVSKDKSSSVAPSVNGQGDAQHLASPHAAIRAASRLGSLRQKRNKDGPPSLKEVLGSDTDDSPYEPQSMASTSTSKNRKAVRSSWCAGMHGFTPSGLPNLFQQFQQQQQQNRSPLSTIASGGSSSTGSPAISASTPQEPFNPTSLNEAIALSTTPTSKKPSSSTASSSPVSPRTITLPPHSPSSHSSTLETSVSSIPIGRRSSPPVKLQPLQVSSP